MKIGIAGCTGRVGQLLIQELQTGNWNGLTLVAGSVRDVSKAAEISGYAIVDTPEALFEHADLVIDFTTPEATLKHIEIAARTKTKMIIGTTGLSESDETALHAAAKDTAIIYAANTSIGVTLLSALVEKTAQALGEDWDIEIFESHHKHKIDAPSGTALALGKAAAKGRGATLPHTPSTDRSGQRESGEIGFSVARGGDVIGEHTVFFFGDSERIELTHKAGDRSLFAKGALRAALWVQDKDAGIFTMRDVLDI